MNEQEEKVYTPEEFSAELEGLFSKYYIKLKELDGRRPFGRNYEDQYGQQWLGESSSNQRLYDQGISLAAKQLIIASDQKAQETLLNKAVSAFQKGQSGPGLNYTAEGFVRNILYKVLDLTKPPITVRIETT